VIEIVNTIGDHPGEGTQTATAEVRARLHHCFGDTYRIRLTLAATHS
jgi:hypothetical protein